MVHIPGYQKRKYSLVNPIVDILVKARLHAFFTAKRALLYRSLKIKIKFSQFQTPGEWKKICNYPTTIFAEAVQMYSGIGSSSFHWIDIGFEPVWLT